MALTSGGFHIVSDTIVLYMSYSKIESVCVTVSAMAQRNIQWHKASRGLSATVSCSFESWANYTFSYCALASVLVVPFHVGFIIIAKISVGSLPFTANRFWHAVLFCSQVLSAGEPAIVAIRLNAMDKTAYLFTVMLVVWSTIPETGSWMFIGVNGVNKQQLICGVFAIWSENLHYESCKFLFH